MKKISIIIPVYNVEKYIVKCLNSCLEQKDVNPSDYEIIIVNDGTLDNSINLITPIAAEYSNVKIINKLNGGLSSARNEGLRHASGEYVWFVDSDDYINNDSISKIVNDIALYECDVLFYDVCCINEHNCATHVKKMSSHNLVTTQTGGEWLGKGVDMWPMAQMYVFKKKFLVDNNLSFKEGILHEDVEFKFKCLIPAKSVTYIPIYHYNYLNRVSGSISAHYSPKRKLDLYDIIREEVVLLNEISDRSLLKNASFALARNYENYINFLASNRIQYEETMIEDLHKIVKDKILLSLFIAPLKYKIKIILGYACPQLLYKWFMFRRIKHQQ